MSLVLLDNLLEILLLTLRKFTVSCFEIAIWVFVMYYIYGVSMPSLLIESMSNTLPQMCFCLVGVGYLP